MPGPDQASVPQNRLGRQTVAVHVGLLLLLMASYVALTPFSGLNLDFSRDLRLAADIADGLRWPLVGPILASTIHLGPIWYYLLAALQTIGFGYLGTTVILALLGALQFPLCWQAGRLAAGRRAGMVWAMLLLVPSWSMLEQVYLGHTLLTGAAMAAVLLLALRYVRNGRMIDFVGMALAFSLALHAHPSIIVFAVLPVVVMIWGFRHHQLAWHTVALAAFAATVPFVPWLIDQWLSGWTFIAGVSNYMAGEQSEGRLLSVGTLAWALAGGGLHYWLEAIAGWPAWLALGVALAHALVCLLGVAGAVKRALDGDRVMQMLLLSLVVGLIGVALIRAIYPYYMMTGLRVVFLGVVAIGLTSRSPFAGSKKYATALMAVSCFTLYWIVAGATIRHQQQATWPLAFVPTFNVTAAWHEHAPYPFNTALGTRSSGRWLCRHQQDVVHGSYAHALVFNYSVEARLRCRHQRVLVGGPAGDSQHWLGLSSSLLQQAGRQDAWRVGNFGILPVRRILGEGVRFESPGDIAFPPLPVRFADDQHLQLQFELQAGEHLAISNLAFSLSRDPELTLWCGQRRISPLAADRVSQLFDHGQCPTSLRLEIASPDLDHLDLVIF